MIIPLKRKYRPRGRTGDYSAPKYKSSHNDGLRRKRSKSGPKTYDKNKHVLVVSPTGKKRMVHL